MKKFKKIFMLLSVTMTLSVTVPETMADQRSYTYTYDYFKFERESPDAYTATDIITGNQFGIGDFKNADGLFVRGNDLYVCDTGNNRIVVFTKLENGELEVKEEIKEVTGAKVTTLAGPTDIFVTKEGDRYIVDKQNQRILHTDSDNNVILELTKPEDETIASNAEFFPNKVLVDNTGRIIALVDGYNEGFLQFTPEGEFIGYLGANKVKFDPLDYLWKSFATDAQKAQMIQFVPTEYSNLAFDKEGFIYATTDVFDVAEIRTNQATPIRKLNATGQDILVKNGITNPMGDLSWGAAGDVKDASRFNDITILDNDIYMAIDRTRGKIFAYDYQGNLLYAFGGIGNKLGYFQNVTSIEHIGTDLYVLDGRSNSITTFSLTEYGELINTAIQTYVDGYYQESGEYWKEVQALNGNYELASEGVGRAFMQAEDYEKAMEYFERTWDDDNYSKAFKLYRKDWIEDNIGTVISLIMILIVLWASKTIFKKIKGGILDDDY
ncbi:hypothetical protein AN641_01620 [Candidatus Epulonipiscioides gigas]|nr:hypothetical protein AN641_01620 [Epulopiscium sp. SCG-C07WGA-EpuloA2]